MRRKRHTLSAAQRRRLLKMVEVLKQLYPHTKTELLYSTPIQLVVAVILSAQCTDARVNTVTSHLWKKYTYPSDFAYCNPAHLAKEINSISYFNSKAAYIIETARRIHEEYHDIIPNDKHILTTFRGIGSKTANVILGQLYNNWQGIAVDTHVKRFVKKFDITRSSNANFVEQLLCEHIPRRQWKYVNNGLVLYGRYVCKARKHDCASCALTRIYPKASKQWPKAT